MTRLELEVFNALKNIHKKLTGRVQEELEPLGLTSVQANVITQLHKNKSMQLSELALCLGMTFPNCSTICQRLERDGLINRSRDLNDHRIVNLTLTDEGEKRYVELARVITEMNQKMLKTTTDEELNTILSALHEVENLL